MVLAAIFGNLGSGKTLYLTMECYYRWKKGQKIFTNFKLKHIPHTQITRPEDIITVGLFDEAPYKFIALDEGYLWFDALEKSSNKQQFYRNLTNITRKLGLDIYFTTQTLGQIYYRSRLLLDYTLSPRYNKRKQTLKVQPYFSNMYGEFEPTQRKLLYYKINRFFVFYNSWEIINDFIVDYSKKGKPSKLNNNVQMSLI